MAIHMPHAPLFWIVGLATKAVHRSPAWYPLPHKAPESRAIILARPTTLLVWRVWKSPAWAKGNHAFGMRSGIEITVTPEARPLTLRAWRDLLYPGRLET